MSRPWSVLRVFARGDDGGNHLRVVNDVDDVPAVEMQLIAACLEFPEAVIADLVDAAQVLSARIFTPVHALPFARNPLVGANIRGQVGGK